VATVQHDMELRNAREELERRLETIHKRRDAANGHVHAAGVSIADVVRVVSEAGVLPQDLDEETAERLLADLIERRLIELSLTEGETERHSGTRQERPHPAGSDGDEW